MKLNYDCVRDVLLYLEDNLTINNSIAFPSDIKESLLLKYSKDDLLYTVKILLNKKLILGDDNFNYATGMYTANIESLSFDGHSFWITFVITRFGQNLKRFYLLLNRFQLRLFLKLPLMLFIKN